MIPNVSRMASRTLLLGLVGVGFFGTACAHLGGSKESPPVATAPSAPARLPPTQTFDEKPVPNKLVSEEMESHVIAGFKKFYVSRAAKPPSFLLVFKSESLYLSTPAPDGWRRITRAELEPYLTKPLRKGGVVVYDQATDRGEILLEVTLSSRQVPYFAPEGDSTNEIPDIRLTARRAADMAIIGQSSTFELLGIKRAWSIYRRIGERELLRATVLTLMEDMIINSAESASVGEIKDMQGKTVQLALTREDYLRKGTLPAGPVLPPPGRRFALTREDYLRKGKEPDQPLKPIIADYTKDLADRIGGGGGN
jgi:hypothetical protein